LFVSWNTCANLESTVLEDDGLGSFGFYTIASLYFSLTIFAFLSTAIVKKLGVYTTFVIGSLFHFTFVLINILPAVHADFPTY